MSQDQSAAELVDDALNELQVTDRVFHALQQTAPLVEHIISTVRGCTAGGRILVIGPNSLLAAALQSLAFEVELWQVLGSDLPGTLHQLVTRSAELDQLFAEDHTCDPYDVVILPYVLEATTHSPELVLGRLYGLLAADGRLLVASASVGRLLYRLRGLMGRSQLDQQDREPSISLNWPISGMQRTIDQWELRRWAEQAGYAVETLSLIMDKTAVNPIVAMRARDWLVAKAAYMVRSAVPIFRDCLVVTMRPLPSGRRSPQAGDEEVPRVSVAVVAEDPGRTERLLGQLKGSTYPLDRMEVILMHSALDDFGAIAGHDLGVSLQLVMVNNPSGPVAANHGLESATGDVMAFTDDLCHLSAEWVESGVAATSGPIAAATGEIVAEPGSLHPLMALPGARPTAGEHGYDRVLFPSASTFYRREDLLEVGGFDERQQSTDGPVWGWDSDAAYRLHAAGFGISFDNAIFISRHFPLPRARDWISREYRMAKDIPMALRRMPQLRRTLLRQGIFLTPQTRAFDLMLVGVALALRRRPAYLLMAIPWMRSVSKVVRVWPPGAWPSSLRHAIALPLRHGCWLVGLLTGSVEARRLVL